MIVSALGLTFVMSCSGEIPPSSMSIISSSETLRRKYQELNDLSYHQKTDFHRLLLSDSLL
jgi:hypothetical protein